MIADYTGLHIGDLTVLEALEPEEGKQGRSYLCRCSCGRHCIKTSSQLSKAYNYGQGAHCGCKSKKAKKAYKDSLHLGKEWY